MQKNILNRWILIIISLSTAIILLINDYTYYSGTPKNNNQFLFDSNIINLGLDLRGGSEYLLSPKIDKWVLENNSGNRENRQKLANAIKDMREDSQIFDLSTLNTYLQEYGITVENIFSGETVESLENAISEALSSNKDIIRRRIDTRGVIEPSVRVNGNKISVEIPGDQSIDDIESLITTSAALEFSQVIYAPPQIGLITADNVEAWENGAWNIIKPYPDLRKLVDRVAFTLNSNILYIKEQNVEQFRDAIDLKKHLFDKTKLGYFKPDNRFGISFNDGDLWIGTLKANEPDVSGENVLNAYVQSDGTSADVYMILLDFDESGSAKWALYTEEKARKGIRVAITLDDVVLTYPTIQSRIDGTSQITGFTDYQTPYNITIALNNGKFNLPLQIDSEYKTGPELGEKMISLGLFAFIIGVTCVIVFMIIYYRVSGIIASIALIINILLMSAILSLLGATLTLPGIAGFILTVGIAVDANVIVFERIKEEIRKGTPPLSSIEAGYDRAFITILDANITTLLTAFILYSFGTGPIKGFAITLGAGILCSMFTAIYVTRTIFGTLYYSKFPKKLSI